MYVCTCTCTCMYVVHHFLSCSMVYLLPLLTPPSLPTCSTGTPSKVQQAFVYVCGGGGRSGGGDGADLCLCMLCSLADGTPPSHTPLMIMGYLLTVGLCPVHLLYLEVV